MTNILKPPATDSMSTKRLRYILSGSAGNLVEYFDWMIYATFGLYFAPVFFPENNQTVQLLNNAAIFAVGFLLRPLGGFWLSRLADRKGRKSALLLSVSLMGLGSMIIAFTPGYAVIGGWAPALLLFARMLQGFSIGGEYGSSATYLSEMAPWNRRGFYSSFQYVTIVLGQILALGLLMLLQTRFLTGEELHEWGWRIGFLAGGILAIAAMGLRSMMAETAAFTREQTHSHPKATLGELLKYPKQLLTVIALTAGGTVSYYTFTVYLQKFLVNTTGFSKADATTLCTLALIVFMLVQPVFGLISDFIGRRTMLIAFGIGGTVFTAPILGGLAEAKTMPSALFWYVCGLLIVSCYSSVNAIVKAELFPVYIRALGVGFPYALTVSLLGGSAEYIALWLKSVGHPEWFFYYVSACAALSLVVAIAMKEPMKASWLAKE